MKIFFIRIIQFLVVFTISAFFLIGITFFLVKNEGIKFEKGKNILVIGDSHTECAIDDKEFKRSVNFSESGNTFYFSKVKLEQALKDNPEIDTVLLSFHFGSLDFDRETDFAFNEIYNLDRLPKFLPFMSLDNCINYYNKIILIKSLFKVPAVYFNYILKVYLFNQIDFRNLNFGMFISSNRNKLAEDIKSRQNLITEKKGTNYSTTEEQMLNEINQICRGKNTKLILINTPVFNAKKYTDVSFYNQFCNNKKGEFDFLDLSNFPIDSVGFGDISHLNSIGARIFSSKLSQVLEQRTLKIK